MSAASPSVRLRLGAVLAAAFGAVVALAPAIAAAQSVQPPQVAAPQPAALSPVAQKFLAAVRANFPQWDLNHDGVLTREEIEIDMQNPRIVGEAAAALAALKIGSTKSNHLADTRTFTPADIDAVERQLAERQKLDPNFVRYFAAGLKKLDEQPRQLFVDGAPQLNAIRQDFTTDCYFLSAVGAVAHLNPQTIVRLIAPLRDGSFTVTFPGRPAMRVTPPTDAEIATYTIAKDGLWLSVLEKAYAIIRIQMEPQQASTREPLDSVGFRTGSTRVMELFTGHASRGITFPAASHQELDERPDRADARCDPQCAARPARRHGVERAPRLCGGCLRSAERSRHGPQSLRSRRRRKMDRRPQGRAHQRRLLRAADGAARRVVQISAVRAGRP